MPYSWSDKELILSPAPVYPLYEHYFRFVISIRNLIDLAAILPYFINLVIPSISLNNNFLRVLRIVRVFEMLNRFKEVETMIGLLVRTMKKSSYALAVMILLSIVGVVFFGSVMFALESGNFIVNSDFPQGAFLRTTWTGLEVTPFTSIGVTMYFVITTITTGKSTTNSSINQSINPCKYLDDQH